jgi:hypothetical protein
MRTFYPSPAVRATGHCAISEAEAIAAWNRRAPAEPDPIDPRD